jgi:hypothetical protein
MSFVYWIYDKTCSDPSCHGYVGVSENPLRRHSGLRATGRVPADSKLKDIFEGTRKECLKLEQQLRPERDIGWNIRRGGKAFKPKTRRPLGLGFNFIKNRWDEPLKNAWRGKR